MERTEVEELIEQAEAVLRKWRKPSNEHPLSNRTMQELLDGVPSPKLRVVSL